MVRERAVVTGGSLGSQMWMIHLIHSWMVYGFSSGTDVLCAVCVATTHILCSRLQCWQS